MDYDNITLATEALREAAKTLEVVDAAGIVAEQSNLSPTGRALAFTLDRLGQLETVSWTEPYSGTNQVVWKGKRLIEHGRPSIFPATRT